jgi:opacity protein-like surface antigen
MISMAIALCVVSTVDGAEADWQLRVTGVWTDLDVKHCEIQDDGSRIQVGSDAGWGLGFGLERRFSDLIGLDLGVDWSQPEVTIDASHPDVGLIQASDTLTLWTFRAGLNFHLISGESFDVYVGPAVAWLRPSSELRFRATYEGQSDELRAETSNELGWGATAGFDLSLGEYWMLCGSASYLKADLETTNVETGDDGNSDLDPLSLRLGVGLRF